MEGKGKLHQKTIIAMKGLPHTGKTSIAKVIEYWLEIPIFTLDNMLEILCSNYCSAPAPSCQRQSDYIRDLAFNMVCRIAKSQLEAIKHKDSCVIIDSPLSSRVQLDCLIRWAKSLSADGFEVKILIVECQRRNNYAWQMSFEDPHNRINHQTKYWYKDQCWDDVAKSIKDYYELNQVSDYGDASGIKICKLVLDPTLEIDLRCVLTPQLSSKPVLVEAVNYLMNSTQCDDDDLLVMDLEKWRKSHHAQSRTNSCKSSHLWTHFNLHNQNRPDDDDQDLFCLSCKERISVPDSIYGCKVCSILLHKSCADLTAEEKEFQPITRDWLSDEKVEYNFPQLHCCNSCTQEGREFSHSCESCILITHLRCRLCPTVINHPGHKHLLSIDFDLEDDCQVDYICLACGQAATSVQYSCRICDVRFHSECLFLPCEALHEHHGYRDRMKLKFSPDEELEDYICNVCEQKRDPKQWFYYCEECDYAAHRSCIEFELYRGPLIEEQMNEFFLALKLQEKPSDRIMFETNYDWMTPESLEELQVGFSW